jgi:hypothetical protein
LQETAYNILPKLLQIQEKLSSLVKKYLEKREKSLDAGKWAFLRIIYEIIYAKRLRKGEI